MRIFTGALLLAVFVRLSPVNAFAQPAPVSGLEISSKADDILKLQEQILSRLDELKQELYVIKIRASRHNRVQHA